MYDCTQGFFCNGHFGNVMSPVHICPVIMVKEKINFWQIQSGEKPYQWRLSEVA